MLLSLLQHLLTPSQPVQPEARLVLDAARGNADAFRRLHDRFAPAVHAVALARAPLHDADDLVQETFLRAWERLPSLHDHERFGPWLLAIARHHAADLHRRRRPTLPLPDDLPARHTPTAEARELLRHLRDLPDPYREPLIMRLVEGLDGPEIAARTGLTPGSVRVNLHRGMKLLRQRLGLEDTP